MSEHNTAIRMAQKYLRAEANKFQGRENGNRDWEESPFKRAYLAAANDLEFLIIEEES